METIIQKSLAKHLQINRKRNAYVTVTDSAHISSQKWDEGSRNSYYFMDLRTGGKRPINDNRSWPESMKPLGKVEIPAGNCIVNDSIFRGKSGAPHYYVNTNNANLFGLGE